MNVEFLENGNEPPLLRAERLKKKLLPQDLPKSPLLLKAKSIYTSFVTNFQNKHNKNFIHALHF